MLFLGNPSKLLIIVSYRTIEMDEFIKLITDGKVVDENFGSREIGISFNLAIFTQVDEIDDDRHMKMYLDEFMDALGRVADRLCIQSPYERELVDKSILAQRPTHQKLKVLIEILLKNTMKKEFVEFCEKKILIDCKPGPEADLIGKSLRIPNMDKTQNSICSKKSSN